LVAIHQACQSLLSGEADMQLAGGITIRVPEKSGSLYQEGMINSPDGHCKAFDKDAAGTVAGNGVGVVVLKRLEDAIADRDHIYAVIKASAIDNDGDDKVGYSAPSVGGQLKVIAAAQALAEVPVETIGFIEGHGSGTKMGDPIEVEALRNVFEKQTDAKQYCALGSVKSNIGHLDAAAGVAGFIKTVLAIYNDKIPPTVGYQEPNPLCEFENSPFFVNKKAIDWIPSGVSRRAAVSSFGMGGTNAHIILEEAPRRERSGLSRPWNMLSLSGKTAQALDRLKDNLRADLQGNMQQSIADIAFTLNLGRHHFNHNFIVLCRDTQDGYEKISMGHNEQSFGAIWDNTERQITFMFSGQGTQYVNMARDLYENEKVFRECVDYCEKVLEPHIGFKITETLYPPAGGEELAAEKLSQTSITQPALFTVEYSLARTFMSWGIKPQSMIGHSIGEYVAACISDVMSIDDALYLVSQRGRLIQSLPSGDMLFIPKSSAEVEEYCNDKVALATANSPIATVLSGDSDSIALLQKRIASVGIHGKIIRTSHAFHSQMMDPILEDFKLLFEKITLRAPKIPIVSNVTGDWLTAKQAVDPAYWASHLRQTVKFSKGIEKASKGQARYFLEIGPGNSLVQFAGQTLGRTAHKVDFTLPRAKDQEDSVFTVLRALGKLWLQGADISWTEFYRNETRNRLSLSTYPFKGNSYWVNVDSKREISDNHLTNKESVFWSPVWVHQPIALGRPRIKEQAIIFLSPNSALVQSIYDMSEKYDRSIFLESGQQFKSLDSNKFIIGKGNIEDFELCFSKLSLDIDKTLDVFYSYPTYSQVSGDYNAARSIEKFITFLRALATLVTGMRQAVRLTVFTGIAFQVKGNEKESWEKQSICRILQAANYLLPLLQWQFIDCGELMDDTVLATSTRKKSVSWLKIFNRSAHNYDGKNKNNILTHTKLLYNDLCNFSEKQIVAYRDGRRWKNTLTPFAIHDDESLQKTRQFMICGEINQFSGQFIAAWNELYKGSYKLVVPEKIAPKEEWDKLAQEQQPQYKVLVDLRNQGVDISVLTYDLDDLVSLRVIVERLVNSGSVGIFNFINECGNSEPGRLLEINANGISNIIRKREYHVNSFANLPTEFCIWISRQRSLFSYPFECENLIADIFSQVQGKSKGQRFIYLNDDFFENDINKDWMQRVPRAKRIEQVARATRQEVSADFVWISASSPNVYKWKPLSKFDDNSQLNEKSIEKEYYERPELSTPYAAPITERQKIICGIWQEMFQIDKVGIHDNFFDLGGDSVMALKLLSDLELRFKVALPLSEVINAPTVAQQSNSVVEYSNLTLEDRKVSPLVKLQAEGTKPPFFCVHPAGGIIHCYIEMARILGKDQPFFAFQHPGIDGKSEPYTSYKNMAELYVQSMREVQPKGPYFIGGWSFGGTVAYEMAVQLAAQGEKIAMLALFDSPAPSALYQLSNRPEFEFAGMLAFLSQALATMFGGEIHVPVDEMRKIPREQQLDFVLGKTAAITGDGEIDNARESLERIIDIFEVCDVGEREYVPAPFADKLYMYRVQELADYEFTGYKDHPQLKSATFGWEELADDVVVRFVPGTHISMIFKPNVQVLAEKLQTDLNNCIADTLRLEALVQEEEIRSCVL